ncbi:ROK family protein [Kitasatospora mediocidica]|uniref:ROK family protein n=1 Tax=Kitasatospora mediocidica TaxID=58352 RepID=UPI000A0541DF|nr:ROK family protein [Kitasatospora mediocidica]
MTDTTCTRTAPRHRRTATPTDHRTTTTVAALDIGGTKMAGAIIDSAGRRLARAQRATPADGSSAQLGAALADLVGELRASSWWDDVTAVGIGSTGPVDTAGGTITPVNIPGWQAYPIADEVSRMAAGLPARLAGDAIAMAQGEQWLGAARGCANALCMVVSTGVGGGLILDHRVRTGDTGNAGHIGHISVDMNGERCVCGARGCVETMASGPAILRYALAHGWSPPADTAATTQGVAEAAGRGDTVALAAFDRAGQALAAGIAATSHLAELRLAVIGGGVAKAGPILFEPIRAHLADYATLAFASSLQIRPALLEEDAGLVGAAAAAFELHG